MDPRRIIMLGIVITISLVIGVSVYFQERHADPSGAPPQPAPPVSSQPPAPADNPPPAGGQSSLVAPSFDIARVEPTGEALVAGRAAPGSTVELVANGIVLDRAQANADGEFLMSPPTLGAGSYDLTLRVGEVVSSASVAVAVPQPGEGDVLVVVGKSGEPSKIVQAGVVPEVAPAAPAESAEAAAVAEPAGRETASLRIAAVEAEQGRLFVQGEGPEGARTRIYLNNQPLADAVVGHDEKWSLTVEQGVSAGDYQVRADQVDAGGKVAARAEVPFSAGQQVASSDMTPTTPEPPSRAAGPTLPQPMMAGFAPSASTGLAAVAAPSGDAANPVVKAVSTVKIRRGDSLWRISRATYGSGVRFSTIYEANLDQIRDPDLIYPDQIFVMPPTP
jgi:nucleoid-associated protein YgaU